MFMDTDMLFRENKVVDDEELQNILKDVDGILIPGGFGVRGIEGKIEIVNYARKHNIPFFGICLGMQCAVIEFARTEFGYKDANSAEFDPETTHPVIDLMPDQKDIEDMGGTMRLGAYPCVLKKDSLAYSIYDTDKISERHRHRYEFNNEYRKKFEEKGMMISGVSPDNHLVEIVEIPDHPFFIGVQFHPEFKSRLEHSHPIFHNFIKAALAYNAKQKTSES